MTTGRNLWACCWNSEGNAESKDFTHNLTLDVGLIWRGSTTVDEWFALRSYGVCLDQRRKKPGVRKGVLEVRGWIGDRNLVPESVRLSMWLHAGTALTCFFSCDYLDPALAWCGLKDSGRGVSLSKFGLWFIVFPTFVLDNLEIFRLRPAHKGKVSSYENQDFNLMLRWSWLRIIMYIS